MKNRKALTVITTPVLLPVLVAADCNGPPIEMYVYDVPRVCGGVVRLGESFQLIADIQQWTAIDNVAFIWGLEHGHADLNVLTEFSVDSQRTAVEIAPNAEGPLTIILAGVAEVVGCGIPGCPDPFTVTVECSVNVLPP